MNIRKPLNSFTIFILSLLIALFIIVIIHLLSYIFPANNTIKNSVSISSPLDSLWTVYYNNSYEIYDSNGSLQSIIMKKQSDNDIEMVIHKILLYLIN